MGTAATVEELVEGMVTRATCETLQVPASDLGDRSHQASDCDSLYQLLLLLAVFDLQDTLTHSSARTRMGT